MLLLPIPFSVKVILFVVLVMALSVHEFCHAYVAYRLGDPTPGYQGRLTLNPLAHLDPVGMIMILIVGFGWGKPVQSNPAYFRNPERDFTLVSAAGPLSNIAQGIFWGLLLRIVVLLPSSSVTGPTLLVVFLSLATHFNFVLAFFNAIPLGPLDGSKILSYFLPAGAKRKYHELNRHGFPILLALIFIPRILGPAFDMIGWWIFYPSQFLARLISGIPVF